MWESRGLLSCDQVSITHYTIYYVLDSIAVIIDLLTLLIQDTYLSAQ